MALRDWINRIRNRPPRIKTQWGDVTESARLRAALNMKEDPIIRAAVEEMLAGQYGGREAGLRESRRRYPEAYEEVKADA